MPTVAPVLSVLLSLCLVFASLAAGCHAAESGIFLTETVQLKVADTFLEEGEYYRAVTEFKRFLILFPDSERADYALFKTGLACYQGEEYDSAVRAFRSLRERYRDSGYSPQAYYFEGLSCWKDKRYQESRRAFESLVETYPASGSAPLALVAAAMLALEQENVDASRRGLQTLTATYPDDPISPKAREAMKLLEQYEELPQKSEVLAGVMSAVVPGSGYFYAEHYGDGFTAFLINALAIAGIVTATYQENYAVAGIVGGIGLPFYFGNIYGSANATKKWNLAVKKEFRNRIQVTLSYDLW